MKMHFATLILIVVCVFCSALGAAKDENELTNYDHKVIEQFKKYGHMSGGVGYPEGHQYWEDLKWFYAQKEKVRPALMYLLEHEYKGQWEKMSDVMNGLGNREQEDQSDLVAHIRKNLPKLIDNEDRQKNRYKHKSIRFIVEYGDASDLPLLEKFLNVEGELPKFHVKKNIQKLKDRLARGEALKNARDNRGKRPQPVDVDNQFSNHSPKRDSSKPAPVAAVGEISLWSKWPIMLAVIFVLGGIFIWLKAKSRA